MNNITKIKKGHDRVDRWFWMPLLKLVGKLQRQLDRWETRLTKDK